MDKEKMYTAPTICPVCGEKLAITQLSCGHCHTRLEGNFEPGPLGRLNPEQCRFVEIFLANRGNLREAGKVLGLSYPTMRLRLDDILNTMGISAPVPSSQAVLEQLQKGELTLEEAMAHFSDEE